MALINQTMTETGRGQVEAGVRVQGGRGGDTVSPMDRVQLATELHAGEAPTAHPVPRHQLGVRV